MDYELECEHRANNSSFLGHPRGHVCRDGSLLDTTARMVSIMLPTTSEHCRIVDHTQHEDTSVMIDTECECESIWRERLTTLQQDNHSLSLTNDRLVSKCNDLLGTLSDLTDSANRLQGLLQEERRNGNRLKEENIELREQIEELKRENCRMVLLEQEMSEMRSQIASRMNQLDKQIHHQHNPQFLPEQQQATFARPPLSDSKRFAHHINKPQEYHPEVDCYEEERPRESSQRPRRIEVVVHDEGSPPKIIPIQLKENINTGHRPCSRRNSHIGVPQESPRKMQALQDLQLLTDRPPLSARKVCSTPQKVNVNELEARLHELVEIRSLVAARPVSGRSRRDSVMLQQSKVDELDSLDNQIQETKASIRRALIASSRDRQHV